MPSKKIAKSFINLLLYMNDITTPKPLVVSFPTVKDAKDTRMEFYAFRRAVIKNPEAYVKKGSDGVASQDTMRTAIDNMEKIEVRLRDSQLEFDVKNEKATMDAFSAAFQAARFKEIDGLHNGDDDEGSGH